MYIATKTSKKPGGQSVEFLMDFGAIYMKKQLSERKTQYKLLFAIKKAHRLR
jgi:hypothetical protein